MSFDAPIYSDRPANFIEGSKSYSPELAAIICARMSAGEHLTQICRDPNMPAFVTIQHWVVAHPEFAPLFEAARRLLYLSYADEIIDIADDGTNDWIARETRSGRMVKDVNREHVSRSECRIRTRQWMLERMLPKMFGNSAKIEVSGKDGAPIAHSATIVAAIAETNDPNLAAKLYSQLVAG